MQNDVEVLLARLLVNGDLRERFLQNPKGIASHYGLSEEECRAMESVSAPRLRAAARSYERKRSLKQEHAKCRGLKGWFRHLAGAARYWLLS